MRKFLQWLLRRPITWLASNLSSAPRQPEVFSALSKLLEDIEGGKTKKGQVHRFNLSQDRIIIFSDQHKGDRGPSDDFRAAEPTYLAALKYYDDKQYFFVSLGDSEELWKFLPEKVMKANAACFAAEKRFEDAGRFYRVFGNHDLEWKYSLQRNLFLKPVFGKKTKVFEGLLLKTEHQGQSFSIFLTHGHQGDQKSDGNRFSIWVVANLWTPIQRYLQVSINTPATSFALTDKHNFIMYEWSAVQQNLVLISGHTHKPVFASLDHVERLLKAIETARRQGDEVRLSALQADFEARKKEYFGKQNYQAQARPSYFNTGCCCFDDGDITGIEMEGSRIRLVKWHGKQGPAQRQVLEEASLEFIFDQLAAGKHPIDPGNVHPPKKD